MTKAIIVGGGAVNLKADGESAGEVTAAFATLDVVDHDLDVMLPGSIGNQKVLMSDYGHASWGGMFSGAGPMPIGKGRTFEDAGEGRFAGNMDMDDPEVVRKFKRMQFLGDMQQWSFSLENVRAEKGERDGQQVQLIKATEIHEVSPVFKGAGINTRLIEAKSRDPDLQSEIDRLKAVISDRDAEILVRGGEIDRLLQELKQERNATAAGLFRGMAL